MQTITTAAGRRLAVEATPDEYGRVVYTVAKIGAFTIEPDTYDYWKEPGSRPVDLRFGRLEGPIRYPREDLPDRPVVCSVELAGTATFRPAAMDGRDGWWLAVSRKSGGRAPTATARRTEDIVRALVTDWLARDDHAELLSQHHWHMAPRRVRAADDTISRLNNEVANRLAELAVQHRYRSEQLTILGQAPSTTAPFPDPALPEGQAILALRSQLTALHDKRRWVPAAEVSTTVERWLDDLGLTIAPN